jgi:hypothetical protein
MHRRHHTILEAVAALVLLTLVVTAIASTLKAAATAKLRTSQTARCLLILENVTEQLPGRSSWSRDEVAQLLQTEFSAVKVPHGNTLSPSVETTSDTLRLGIIDERGRFLARINIPLTQEVAQ